MTSFPETRASLIARIADAGDAPAWSEFAQLYRPAIYRLACRQGMQHADAEELAQEAMLAVARTVRQWAPQRGRFRNWLFRIARNLTVNFLTRRKYRVWAAGNSQMQSALARHCDGHGALSQLFELEYRRVVFRCAAQRVQRDVTESTWEAFWLSSVDDVPIAE